MPNRLINYLLQLSELRMKLYLTLCGFLIDPSKPIFITYLKKKENTIRCIFKFNMWFNEILTCNTYISRSCDDLWRVVILALITHLLVHKDYKWHLAKVIVPIHLSCHSITHTKCLTLQSRIVWFIRCVFVSTNQLYFFSLRF